MEKRGKERKKWERWSRQIKEQHNASCLFE